MTEEIEPVETPFIMWACGHAHQPAEDGRVYPCRSGIAWFIIECTAERGYTEWRGLQLGDYTLHDRHTSDGTFSPATRVSDPLALKTADRVGRRLMIYSLDQRQWVPVMP